MVVKHVWGEVIQLIQLPHSASIKEKECDKYLFLLVNLPGKKGYNVGEMMLATWVLLTKKKHSWSDLDHLYHFLAS